MQEYGSGHLELACHDTVFEVVRCWGSLSQAMWPFKKSDTVRERNIYLKFKQMTLLDYIAHITDMKHKRQEQV